MERWRIGVLTVALVFALLALNRIDFPPFIYFDERFYVAAGRGLIGLVELGNREHPPLAKELIAGSITTLGDNPTAWRLPSLVLVSIGIMASSHALKGFGGSGRAAFILAILLATSFLHFAMARIAMLDGAMFGFAAIGFWLTAKRGRLSGVALGLATACKWTAAPLVASAMAIHVLAAHDKRPAAIHAIVWIGGLSVLAYFATFLPLMLLEKSPVPLAGLLPLQSHMAHYLSLDNGGWVYESRWPAWVLNTGPMWLIHDRIGGAYRMALLAGNPVSMLAMLPALALGLARIVRKDWLMAGPSLIYVVLMAFWIAAPKAHTFYYHYLLAATFGLATLAVALDRWGRLILPVCGASILAFAWFYPVLAPGPAITDPSRYVWYPGWKVKDVAAFRTNQPRIRKPVDELACLDTPLQCNHSP